MTKSGMDSPKKAKNEFYSSNSSSDQEDYRPRMGPRRSKKGGKRKHTDSEESSVDHLDKESGQNSSPYSNGSTPNRTKLPPIHNRRNPARESSSSIEESDESDSNDTS